MMKEESTHFNLIDEPWIRVRMLSGEMQELSLSRMFAEAPLIQSLRNDLPTQDFAILRILLAILQRSISPALTDEDDPAEVWGQLWSSDILPMDQITTYLDNWHDRFNLFDSEHPFMQVSGLRPLNETSGEIKKIIADVPDGNPFFSMKSGNAVELLTYSEAARWLVHAQAFDTSGIKTGVEGDARVKGGKSYPIGTGWAGKLGCLYIEGSNLKETVLLNLELYREEMDEIFSQNDIPAWEREPNDVVFSLDRMPTGRIDLYTWQSRRILLHRNFGGVDNVVLTNGNKLDPQNMMNYEPMTGWRRSKAQEKKLGLSLVYMPAEHHLGRALWRGLDSVLPTQAQDAGDRRPPNITTWLEYLASSNAGRRFRGDRFIKVRAVGFEYGPQNSTFKELIEDGLVLNAGLLKPEGHAAVELARECIEDTDRAIGQLGFFANNLYHASGGREGQESTIKNQAKDRAYFEIDGVFRNWLMSLGAESNLKEKKCEWHELARKHLIRIEVSLIEEVDPSAFIGKPTSRGDWMTAGKAEAIFRSNIMKILPGKKQIQQTDEREVQQ